MRKPRICPKCGQNYNEPPALSRLKGVGAICPDCGTREALESVGASKEIQKEILAEIHSCRKM